MIFYIIYKTTNHVNGMWYIGKHSTDNIDDGYLGSGVYLRKAIRKYGINNFSREILFVLSSKEEMENKEKELVDENIVNDNNSYNLTLGGQGGGYHRNGAVLSEETRDKIRKKRTGTSHSQSTLEKMRGRTISEEHRERIKTWNKENRSFAGHRHSEETKKTMSEKKKNTMWITNGVDSRMVNKNTELEEGWRKGRTCA